MTVEQMAERLRARGFDGLCWDDDCGCGLDDLMRCGDADRLKICCRPAYRHPIVPASHIDGACSCGDYSPNNALCGRCQHSCLFDYSPSDEPQYCYCTRKRRARKEEKK